MDKQLLVTILKFAPLGILLFFTLIYLLWGFVRGFRKSLILFIHALVIGLILFAVFEIIVNQPGLDGFVYSTSKQWVDYTKEPFYASASSTSMNEVIQSAIVHNVDYGEGVELIVKDNGAYLATLANLVLRLAVAIVFFILYLLLVFIMYIIYLIFYPQRRYARKKRQKHEEGEGKPYNRHTLLGGLVGGIRGLIVSILWLSIAGTALFITAGTGDDRPEGYNSLDFTDNKVDSFYEAFDIVNCYGSTGVFKVLNSVKNSDNVPVYLFAANLVLQGKYTETAEDGTKTTYNLYLINELNNYQEFASGIYRILVKYDTENTLSHLNTSDGKAVLDAFVNIISKEGVQAEIDALIDNWNDRLFFVDFGLSMVDSIATHIDELKFYDEMDAQLKDLLTVLLKGKENAEGVYEGGIKVSNLLTKGDIKLLTRGVIDALMAQSKVEGELSDQKRIILYSKALVNQVKEMSFIKDETKKLKTGTVLKNLYEYASTAIDTEYDLSGVDLSPTQWVGELESLLNAAGPALDLYDSVYTDGMEPLEIIDKIFPEDNPELAALNEQRYDTLCNTLCSSNLLDAVMSLSAMRKVIDDALVQINENIKLPSVIQYVDKDGQRGEAYHLLTSLKQLIKTGALSAIIDLSKDNSKDNLSALADKLTLTNDEGKTVAEMAIESTIVKYVISGVVLNLNVDGVTIVVPDSAVEIDDEGIKTIIKSELNTTVKALPKILEVVKDTDNIDYSKLVSRADDLLESDIIEATLIYNLVESLDKMEANEYIVIPDNFKAAATVEALNDTETNIWYTSGEIKDIIHALDELLEISTCEGTFDIQTAVKNVTKSVLGLNSQSITYPDDNTKTRLDVLYDSEILKASVAKVLKSSISTLVADGVLDKPAFKQTDEYDVTYYNKDEISIVLYGVEELGFEDLEDFNADTLKDILTMKLNGAGTSAYAVKNNLTKVGVLYSSSLVKAVLVEQIDKYLTDEVVDVNFRDSLLVKEMDEKLEMPIYKLSEVSTIVDAIAEIDVTDFDKIADKVVEIVFSLNDASNANPAKSKLDILYSSNLLQSAIIKQLDTHLTDELVATDLRDSTLVKEKVDTKKLDNTPITFYVYQKSEIKNIINAANELGITSLDDFNDTSKISDKIFDLCKESTIDPTKEKIDIVYSSNIVKSVVSTQLDNNLTDTIMNANIRDSLLVKDALPVTKINGTTSTVYLYKTDEIRNIINGANELDITSIDDFTDADKIKDKIFTLKNVSKADTEKTKLDVLYSSYIVRGVLAKQLDDNLDDTLMDVEIRDSKLVKDIEETKNLSNVDINVYFYKKAEIINIIDSANELDINNIDDFTNADNIKDKIFTLNDTATTDSTKKKLDIFYSSNIIKSVLAKQLDDNLDDSIIDLNVRDSILVKEKVVAEQLDGTNKDVYLYNQSEIRIIINSAKELGITKIDDFTDADKIKDKIFTLSDVATTDNTKKKMEILYSSYIVKSVLSKQLDDNIDNTIVADDVKNSLLVKDKVDTTLTNGTNVTIYLYLDTEVYGIINSAKELDITSIDAFNNTDTIKNKIFSLYAQAETDNTKTKIEVMYASYIIKSAFTIQLDNNLDDSMVDANILETRLVKHKYETTSVSSTAVTLNLYEENEVYGIINSARELGITSIDALSGSSVKNKILDLNKASETDPTQTKLDILYSSNIIKSAVAVQLDNTLDDTIVDLNTLNSQLVKNVVSTTKLDDSNTNINFYKQTEITILINSLDELGITDISTFDSDSIKDNVLNLNNTSTTDAEKTKLDILYESYIIKSAILKQLDSNLDDTLIDVNVRDSKLVKYLEDTYDLENNPRIISLYIKNEVKYVINSTKELDITTLSGFDANSVKNKLMTLNNVSTTASPSTKLDVLYQSYIIKSILSTQLDANVDDSIVDLDVRDSLLVKELENTNDLENNPRTVNFYQKNEIKVLINSLDELGLDVSTIDNAKVKNVVLNLNNASTANPEKTKLELIYESYIIRSALTKQLNNNISVDVVSNDIKNSAAAKYVEETKDLALTDVNVTLYRQYEVSALIKSLHIVNITDIANINIDTVGDAIFNLTEENVNDLYKSVIITYALSKKLNETFTSSSLSVNTKVLAAKKDNQFSANGADYTLSEQYYQKAEVLLIIDAIGKKGLGKTNLASVKTIDANAVLGFNEIPEGETQTRLDVIYASDILKDIISSKLNTALNSNEAIVNDADAKYEFITDVMGYKKNEISALITALNHLSVTDIDAVDTSTLTLNSTFKADVLASTILYSTVSKQIIDNASLIKPNIALARNDANEITIINKDNDMAEMNHILSALIELGVANMTSTVTLELNSDIIEDVSKSKILRTTVSDKIINNDVIVSVESVLDASIADKQAITEEELSAFLTSITDGFGMSDVDLTTFTAADLALPAKADANLDDKLTILASSVLMRATITSRMALKKNSTESYDIYTLQADAEQLNKLDSSAILVLKQTEMFNAMKSIVYLTDGGSVEAQFNMAALAALSNDDLDTVLTSNIFRIITDDLIAATPIISTERATKTLASENLYKLETRATSTRDILTNVDEYNIIVGARAYLMSL